MSVAASSEIRPGDAKSMARSISCADGSSPRVLLAEDSMAARVLTATLLRRMGCQVDAVEHGEEAVHHMQAANYDVVLMDIEMPVMDGLLAAREIRAMGGEASATPIIALSAFMADSRRAPMWQESFDVSLLKPAGREQLRRTIQTALDLQAGKDCGTAEPVPAISDHGALIDEEAMANFKAQITTVQLSGLLKIARDDLSETSRQLARAADANDVDDTRLVAHKIRGIAATFAAPCLMKMSEELEATLSEEGSPVYAEQARKVCDCVQQTINALVRAAA